MLAIFVLCTERGREKDKRKKKDKLYWISGETEPK